MTVDEPVVPPGHGDERGVPPGAETGYRTETTAGPPTTRSRTPMDDESPMMRRDRTPPPPRAPGAGRHLGAAVREMVVVAAMALALSFIVKTWLMQAFYIPSDSMEDTLVRHDRVVVSKLTPGPMDLKRGDVVVFADPGNWLQEPPPSDRGAFLNTVRDGLIFIGLLPDTSEGHLIKRVIGVPGDRVVCCDKKDRITVNGSPLKEPYIKPGQKPSDTTFDVTVPAGRVWVMGDNRGNSADSRFHDPGAVPIDLIVGRAVAIVWPLDRISMLSDYPDTFAAVPRAGAPLDSGNTVVAAAPPHPG